MFGVVIKVAEAWRPGMLLRKCRLVDITILFLSGWSGTAPPASQHNNDDDYTTTAIVLRSPSAVDRRANNIDLQGATDNAE